MKFVCKITWEEKKLNVWCLKVQSKVSDNFYVLKSFKNYENAFCFTLKALFVPKIFKFLSWRFGHVEKTAWLDQDLCCHNLVNKQLQYTYCPISQEVKATTQWNLLVIEYSMRSIFVKKSYTKCAGEREREWDQWYFCQSCSNLVSAGKYDLDL